MDLQRAPILIREQKPTHRGEMKYLSAFVGEWKVEGTMTGTETYAFLAEEFFLVYEWDRLYGEKKHKGIGFMGYDTGQEKFLAQFCDNLGYARTYDLIIMPFKFLLYGEHERAEISVSEDHQVLRVHWDVNKEGCWSTLCDLTGRKVQ